MVRLCFVKMLPSMLTPFVRSDAVGAILAETFLDPGERTLAQLARRTGVLPAVVHKEVSRLVDAGVLMDRREGNNRLVKVDQSHPLFAPMSEIIAATYGPVPVLRDLLSKAEGVAEAFIYGSWAARRSGVSGPFPHDVDVMVIGDLPVDALVSIQTAARERMGIEVNIHRATIQDWSERKANPFLAEVASRPAVALLQREEANATTPA
jgi:DNA-binding transcriptional ArsR family regulator